MCGNSGQACVHRRKQNTDRSTEDSDWKCFSSGERPLHGGVYQKIAPAPGKPISPEENIQNVGRTPAKPPFTGGNKTPTVRRRTATGSGFSSGERPLHGGAFQKIASAPGKPISPEENIQNVGRTPAKPPFTGGNKTPTVRRRTATGRGFSSGEEPLHGGAFQKIAPAPDRLASPKKNIQNVGRTPAKPSFTGGNKKAAAPRRTSTGSGFSSGEGPLHGGVHQKIAPAPDRTVSPEVSTRNAGLTPAKPAYPGEKDNATVHWAHLANPNTKNARKQFSGMSPARLRAKKHSFPPVEI